MTGEITYTAHFEKKAVEAPATRMVTAEYVAGKGGSVSRASETVDALAEGAAFLGSTAEAADGYAFVNWTAADGSEAGTDAAFVPSVSPETAERTVYTANFKKINTRPAQDFEGSVSGVSVRVHADEGRFPEGTTMHLAPVSRSSILSNDSVQDAVGEDREVVDAIAVDITFRNKNGDEIEPDGAISVSMSTSRSVSGESHQVLHTIRCCTSTTAAMRVRSQALPRTARALRRASSRFMLLQVRMRIRSRRSLRISSMARMER